MSCSNAKFHIQKHRKQGALKVKTLTSDQKRKLCSIYESTGCMNWIEYESSFFKVQDPCFVRIHMVDGERYDIKGRVSEMEVVAVWRSSLHYLGESIEEWQDDLHYNEMKEAYSIVQSVLGKDFDENC